jgi:transcriptional regulator GlxA family with amidase domain
MKRDGRDGFENLPANGCGQTCAISEHSERQFGGQAKAPDKEVANGALKIEQSIAYMMEHLDKPLQVSALAQRANISPSHYFALFKRRTGSAPIGYFIRLRMRHARDLLDATPASVKEIAAALGYNDPFYFSRVFKSVNQVAPTEYRARRGRNSEMVAADFSRAEGMLKISVNGMFATMAGRRLA